MKNLTKIIILTLALAIHSQSQAQTQAGDPPCTTCGGISGVTLEGTGSISNLSPLEVQDIKEWAKNTLESLKDLQEQIKGQTMVTTKELLTRGIRKVVAESEATRTETLMRYALNRGIVMSDMIEKEAIQNEVALGKKPAAGTVDQQVRLLKTAMNTAIKYYQSDITVINGKAQHADQTLVALEFSKFGLELAKANMDISNSIIDASAQYAIRKNTLDWFGGDLYRDIQKRTVYSNAISLILDEVKILPEALTVTDHQAVQINRRIQKTFRMAQEKMVRAETVLKPTK